MEAQKKLSKGRGSGRGKDSTRRIAASMLAQVTRGKTLDEVRDRLDALDPQERNLADAIVQTSLRHYGEIKLHLAAHMKRALPLRPHIAHALLVTGAAQLLYMNVPPHAAIDETVAATGRQEQPFRGLINAVLRKLAAAQKDGTLAATQAADNLPDWMRARFQAAYGSDGLEAICTAHQNGPALDVCFKNPEKAAAWADKNGAERLTDTHIRLTAPGAVTKLDGFHDGDWFVQDVAAGWPAAMLLEKLDAPSRVLDLCAAPGGKTLQLAAAGHKVTALDISPARLKRVSENLRRTKLSAETVAADAFDWHPQEPFDAIILDAPCSASGTLRRHPDLALNRNEGYIAKLADMQARLLDRAADWLASKGHLVYAVCSLDPEEGETQAEAFLTRHKDFRLIRPDNVPQELLFENCLRTTPADWATRGGMDGFFAALFQKISE